MRLFLLLGANLGDRFRMLEKATAGLVSSVGTLRQQSSLYETAPWGIEDQPPYLNQVLELDTVLPPSVVLARTQAIELSLGRTREQRWGARLIDIDLLYADDYIIQTSELVLPHPLIAARRFVLVPLCELAPDLRHPILGRTTLQLLAECTDEGAVSRITG